MSSLNQFAGLVPDRARAFKSRLPGLAFALVAGLTLAALSPAALAAWNLQQLMDALAQNKSGRANFVEKKYIALLDKPVESSGELVYTAPNRLEKRTFKPKPESLVLDGETLLIERGKRTLVMRLKDFPDLVAFTESIRGTLAGDRQALEQVYHLSLEGSEERWSLTLQPIEPKMLELVRRIRIAGQRADLRSIEIEQSDKDRSVMLIEKAQTP